MNITSNNSCSECFWRLYNGFLKYGSLQEPTNILNIANSIAFSALLFTLFFIYKRATENKTVQIFDQLILNNKANLMLFYTDWCPYCKIAGPEWKSLKTEYEGKEINGHNIMFSEFNCTEETTELGALMDKCRIDGFPAIKLLKDKQIIEYDAKPSKEYIAQFLKNVF